MKAYYFFYKFESSISLEKFCRDCFLLDQEEIRKSPLEHQETIEKERTAREAICYNIKEALYNLKASELGTSRWVKQ